eukprot:5034083-Prymnesium_polylepis.1
MRRPSSSQGRRSNRGRRRRRLSTDVRWVRRDVCQSGRPEPSQVAVAAVAAAAIQSPCGSPA